MKACQFRSLLLTTLLYPAAGQAAVIVDLDPADARFNSLIHNDDGSGGFAAGNPSAAENAAGLTFNVTFTPAAGDLDSTSAAVNILEVGGDANGTGLYLLGGELHFISKMNGNVGNVADAFDDLDWGSGNNMIGVRSSFGPLAAGTEYSVAAIFDPITSNTLTLGILPTGAGGSTIDRFDLLAVGTKTNWSGDDSVTAFRGGNVGNLGGANTVGGHPFSEAAINGNPFEGTQGQALYWSRHASRIPDGASSLGLLAMGFLANVVGLMCCRRGQG